ncbi:MAG: hypothetical protein ACRCSP_02170, partial [Rhodoglobus sp.]
MRKVSSGGGGRDAAGDRDAAVSGGRAVGVVTAVVDRVVAVGRAVVLWFGGRAMTLIFVGALVFAGAGVTVFVL